MLLLNQKSYFNWLNTSLLDMSFTQTQTSANKDNCYGYRSLNLTLNIHHVTFKLIRTITSTCISSDLLRKFGKLLIRKTVRRSPAWSSKNWRHRESRPQFYHDLWLVFFLGSPIVSRFITFTCCDIASTILEMPQWNSCKALRGHIGRFTDIHVVASTLL